MSEEDTTVDECVCFECPDNQLCSSETKSKCCGYEEKNIQDCDLEGVICVTKLTKMAKVWDKDVLEITLNAYNETICLGCSSPPDNSNYRYAAYRVASFLLVGRLGKRRRRPLPACVVSEIRRIFPSPDGIYTG